MKWTEIMTTVSLLPAPANQVIEVVEHAMSQAGWKNYISEGANVSLKVNLGWDIFLPGAVSAPWVVEGVIKAIQQYVGKIYIIESDQVVVDVDKALRETKIDRLCGQYGVQWVNMSRGDFVLIRDDSRIVLKEIYIPEILTRTELISIPVMKTHNKTVITGSLKNQWGCLQTLRHNFHPVLSEALVDVNTLIKPRFAVMDATICLEGNGPKSGIPKELGYILASGDLVALDTIAARIMGFDSKIINHIQLCAKHGLGNSDTRKILVKGEQVDKIIAPFQKAKHNPVSWLELLLRKSFFQNMIFNTPIFGIFCWGARRYYEIWEIMVGKRLRREVLENSPYSKQWLTE